MTPEERQRTMDFILARQANTEIRMDQLVEEHKRFSQDLRTLVRVTNKLVKVSSEVVDRTKRLEVRADGVDEIIKFLRELWESCLRRPDNPPQST